MKTLILILFSGQAMAQDYTSNARLQYIEHPAVFCESFQDEVNPIQYCTDAMTDSCIVYLENCNNRPLKQAKQRSIK